MITTSRACIEKPSTSHKAKSTKRNELWPSKQRVKPGSATEAQLVEKHLPLVKTVVGRLAMTLPPHVDGQDLYSAGLTGLLSAVRQYDPNAGTAF